MLSDVSPLTLERVAARLATRRSPNLKGRAQGRAAVAAILRFDRGGAEVLLIERAVRANDRWSGHVSFPGGREEASDDDLLATAVRETREEVGLDLAGGARVLGALDPVRAMSRGRILPMTIAPFVFHLAEEQPVTLGDEATAAFWLPLDAAARGALDGWTEYKLGPIKWDLPCWCYDGHVVWGLTFHMLRRLLDVVGAPDKIS